MYSVIFLIIEFLTIVSVQKLDYLHLTFFFWYLREIKIYNYVDFESSIILTFKLQNLYSLAFNFIIQKEERKFIFHKMKILQTLEKHNTNRDL